MRNLKAAIIPLLAALILAAPLFAGSASVLLQEGIYAEEIEGDLEGAIKIYRQILLETDQARRTAALAAYRIALCYLKKAEHELAADYLNKIIAEHPDEKILVQKAAEQLAALGLTKLNAPEPTAYSSDLYEQLPLDVLRFVAGKYGAISSEAGANQLYSNAHIYFVTSDMHLLTGGMGYYINSSGQPAGTRIRLSGTSDPDQTLYDVAGRKMNIDIIPDKTQNNFYHIFWTPSEPLPPGQMFYYGWSSDSLTNLKPNPEAATCTINMQNHFGSTVIETFFLVLPKNALITAQSRQATASANVGDTQIYYWSRQVPPNTNNKVTVSIAESSFSEPKTVTLPIILHANADVDLGVKPESQIVYDLDKALEVTIPAEILAAGSQQGNEWALQSGADVIAVTGPHEAGLLGFATVFEKIGERKWDSITPDDLITVAGKKWRMDREETVTAAEAESAHPVYGFKTAQGGVGILQLLEIDRKNLAVKFRYSLLRHPERLTVSAAALDRRAKLAGRMRQLGIAMHLYANDHLDKFPDSPGQMRDYLADKATIDWMLTDVAYLAAGKTAADAKPDIVAAYDKTLLARDIGTNVLFLDAHVEFLENSKFRKVVPVPSGGAAVPTSQSTTAQQPDTK
ncbi:MAG: hypothetical protein JW720_12245 [Sedimentisphaerales bacterium]|nr:hypothetical protein [Sedimentisphaerales bacterium]